MREPAKHSESTSNTPEHNGEILRRRYGTVGTQDAGTQYNGLEQGDGSLHAYPCVSSSKPLVSKASSGFNEKANISVW